MFENEVWTNEEKKKDLRGVTLKKPGWGNWLIGGVAQMVERSLSMREVRGSMPLSSILLLFFSIFHSPFGGKKDSFERFFSCLGMSEEDTSFNPVWKVFGF